MADEKSLSRATQVVLQFVSPIQAPVLAALLSTHLRDDDASTELQKWNTMNRELHEEALKAGKKLGPPILR